MVLLREELGDVLRSARRARGSTLRDVSARASVSLGYLSEIERGEKEASSELVASICQALELPMSVVFTEIAHRADRAERASAPVALPVANREETVVSAA
ncbi:helix-turn-helix domain-containing protein [Janibacter alittae]|uniref:Helix-turn-helix transcriptional regulator n=1 Tax=Janibacter alittae TaxID=3115209 RepID=A0ABZ2ME69_9MICO